MLSVIALTKTWFKSKHDDELFGVEGYHQPFTTTRTQKRGGGVAIYVTLDLEAELIRNEYYESVSVKINNAKKNQSIWFLLRTFRHKNTYLEHVKEVLDKNGKDLQIVCGTSILTDILNENAGARVSFQNMVNSKGFDLVSPGDSPEEQLHQARV